MEHCEADFSLEFLSYTVFDIFLIFIFIWALRYFYSQTRTWHNFLAFIILLAVVCRICGRKFKLIWLDTDHRFFAVFLWLFEVDHFSHYLSEHFFARIPIFTSEIFPFCCTFSFLYVFFINLDLFIYVKGSCGLPVRLLKRYNPHM